MAYIPKFASSIEELLHQKQKWGGSERRAVCKVFEIMSEDVRYGWNSHGGLLLL